MTHFEVLVEKQEKFVEVSSQGPQGPSGSSILSGNGAPNISTGNIGEWYIDKQNSDIYGPKNNSGWGNPTSLIGPQGPQGDPGIGAAVFNQITPSTTWVINHNLGFYPNVNIVDSAGTSVEGSYTFLSVNTVIATFTSEFSGKAYLS